ncbi:MAG: transcriptional regulator PpsR [Polymorphobacter sp.]
MDVRTATADDRATAARAATSTDARAVAGGDERRLLASLPASIAAQALAASCDVALFIDADGVIRDIMIGAGDLGDQGIDSWLNRRWTETVAPENRVKLEEMMRGEGDPGRWRHVNHPGLSGDLPIRYIAVRSDNSGSIVAIGRDMRSAAAFQQRLLRAQQSMERDSLRLRQLEARYRLLFDSASEAILIIDSATRRIIEANPAARSLISGDPAPAEGRAFTALVHVDDREVAVALLAAAAAAEQRQPGGLRLTDGTACRVSATLFRQDRSAFLLVRLQPLVTGLGTAAERTLSEVLERMPDAFVLTDAAFAILASNGAFLDLVQQARSSDVRGEPLARFIGRPGIDLGLLEQQLRDHGAVRNFSTVAHGAGEREEEIDVSAVTSVEGGEIRHGFSLRAIGRRLEPVVEDRQVPRSVEQLTELVGRVSLKEIVRESTDLIERLCIEAALTYTSDNRASAAEILGLSRQSLYSKLHRHGLGNLSDTD